jgi:tetratricopeptide (TPR) repeat protein
MTEKEINTVFKRVEKLIDTQFPIEAISEIDNLIPKLSSNQQWFKARALFWKQLCYKQTLDIKKAELAGKEAYALFKEIGDSIQASNVLRDTASLYEHIGKYSMSLEYLEKALKEIKTEKVLQSLGLALAKKGKIYSELGDFKGAETNLLSAEAVIDSTNNLMHRLTVSTHLTELYIRMKEFRRADFFVNKSERLLKKLMDEKGYLNEIRYSQLQIAKGIIAQSRGKYKEALAYLRKFLKFGIRPKTK